MVSQLRQANPNPLNLAQNFVSLYAQDIWKITHRLTAELTASIGIPFSAWRFQQDDVYNFSLAGFYAGTKSKVVAGAPPGFSFLGDPGFPGQVGH